MLTIIRFASVAAALSAVGVAVQMRSLVSAWTVRQAWNWMLMALLSILVHAGLSLPVIHVNAAVTSAVAYFATTMLLAPQVTILGARRPGIAAWHWFVVLPMLVVLQWPAVSQLMGNHWRDSLELGAPAAMGVVVVLILSAGTLVGKNATSVALLYCSGIVILLGSVSDSRLIPLPATALAPILILAAIWISRRNVARHLHRIRGATTAADRIQCVSELFSCLYGFAWTRRVQDRVNQFGPRENWSVRLTSEGFKRPDGRPPIDEELQKPIEAFMWVLTRFADEAWLRQALNPQNSDDPTNPRDPTV